VINKIDQNPAFELNRKFLQEKYPSIRGNSFYRLSCKSKEGVEEFSKALQEELTKVKHLEIKWPKSWFNVKNKLENMCPNCPPIESNDNCEYCNFIQYEDYKKICSEEGIRNESEQNTLVDFLHDLGVILHFRDIPLLNTHVLEPEWVTNAVYKIVNSKEIAESRGVLKLDMLHEILKQSTERDFYYPPYEYGFFISLMKKFELSYDLDNSTVLLPASLEIQEPNFEFDYEGALKFVIDYDFLSPSVMPRFIVKMNRDIKDDLRWRTGVVLEDKGFKSTAVIKEDNEAKRISIYVDGAQKRDYFAVILQRFREINNSFEKLRATEKIPLPNEPEVTVGYEHLIKLELRGIETYMPDGSDNEYEVSELLGTVINGNGLMEILKEILQKTEMNEKEILKILPKIQKIESESNVEDSLLEKINRSITLNPNVCGVGPNFNEIIKLYLERKKRRS
jgi:internalin A